MSIELITGKAGTPHISSNDYRAFNRANFGQGKYIFDDEDNMAVSVSPITGNITIAKGSCLWSGMHIRVSIQENLTYITPTTSQTVGVYLHYVKEPTSLVETVEFVVTVGTEPTPVIDSLDDNTMEAYALFYSFTASSTAAENETYGFTAAKSHEELETLVNNAHSETVLFEGNANINSTISLTESLRNFYEVEFIHALGGDPISGRRLVSQIPSVGENIDIPMFGAGKWSNTNDTYLKVMTVRLLIKNETELVYTNGQSIFIGNAILENDPVGITKIIGVGRKK